MLTLEDLHGFQHRAAFNLLHNPAYNLWLDCGLGKTIVVLTAITQLRAFGQVDKVLIVAPLRVCETVWEQEAKNWSHTQGLRFSAILGSEPKRLMALSRTWADVYLINYENLAWMSAQLKHRYVDKGLPLPFQLLVWDEVSKMKTSTTKRSKAFFKLIPYFLRKIGLTGTPASNSGSTRSVFGSRWRAKAGDPHHAFP